ncbi:MAG TPA: GSU2403 family nucleotidyltransferase fold protein, partial [Moraxellaceae bacterium]|nr:GSU2403 family nucleotidyltransferase fold protein [Moraxellaceae bacterium]
IGTTPGSVVRKTLKGADYLYYQYRDLDGSTRQAYIGADNPESRALTARLTMRAASRSESLRRLDELRAAFVALGGHAVDHAPLRVLLGFADAGMLQPKSGPAVLVGTHAFHVLGNLLGVKWAGTQTARASASGNEADLDLALRDPERAAPGLREQLGRGFLPAPTLDPRAPLAFYTVRGQTVRVNLLAPPGQSDAGTVAVPALNTMARPQPFLDYLLEAPVPAVVVGRRTLALVTVPAPGRFALYKLLLSESREAMFAARSEEDRQQAMQLVDVLIREEPEELAVAHEALLQRGKSWSDVLGRALRKCERQYPEAVLQLRALSSPVA